VVPPSVAAAESYARSLLHGYRSELRSRGADLFGKSRVNCSSVRGSRFECQIKIPYKQRQLCRVAQGIVFVQSTSTGLETAAGSGVLKLFPQICSIGPHGERKLGP
jgi:hypothetical protein